MKKLSLLVGGLALSTAVFAQKPDASVPSTLEGQIGWNASTLSFNAPSLRYRYFLQDNIAVRVTLGIANSTTTDNFYENADGTGGTGTYEESTSGLNAAIGAEYHFAGTDRLSPYAGIDIMFGSGKYSETATNADAGVGFFDDYSREYEAKTSMFGVNLVGGMDYYFAENFYLGLELGLGWQSTTWKESTETTTAGGTTTTDVTPEMKSSFFGNNAIGTFRLGWRF